LFWIFFKKGSDFVQNTDEGRTPKPHSRAKLTTGQAKFSFSSFEFFWGRAKSEKMEKKILLRRSRRFAAGREGVVSLAGSKKFW
jgi:hypothetical protein